MDPRIDNTVVCNCHQGYVGHKCDKCDVNHWGNPKVCSIPYLSEIVGKM